MEEFQVQVNDNKEGSKVPPGLTNEGEFGPITNECFIPIVPWNQTPE